VKGEYNVYPNLNLTIIPNTKIKKNIHIQKSQISKRDKNIHIQKEKKGQKKYEEKPHQFCTSK